MRTMVRLPPRRDLRVFAKERPGKVLAPIKTDVSALLKPDVFEHWNAGVRAASNENAQNVITIYDVIGEDPWSGGGVTVNRIDAALRKIGNQDIEVHINSPGGDVFEGIAIYNRLQEHPNSITVKIMGLAASAASIIAMAGNDILIGAASFIMIHNTWVVAIGDRNDMAETAAFLKPFDDAIADVYATRSGTSKAKIGGMMDAETYLSGSQAIELGFADGLLSADQMKEDEAAAANARSVNILRATDYQLQRAGLSKAAARKRINEIKGMSGAAPEAMSGAGDTSWIGKATGLIATLRSA
jgi:ATP-dependent Clp protease protease subunit